jgi:hypothetical protein
VTRIAITAFCVSEGGQPVSDQKSLPIQAPLDEEVWHERFAAALQTLPEVQLS